MRFNYLLYALGMEAINYVTLGSEIPYLSGPEIETALLQWFWASSIAFNYKIKKTKLTITIHAPEAESFTIGFSGSL